MTISCIDALSGLKTIKTETINLVISSPPYSDVRKSYKGVKSTDYTNWFTPIASEILRVLTKNGSFILNIKDKCDPKTGERIPYPFEIVLKLREQGFKFIDTIIWTKTNGVPCAGRRRADYFEYIFHFCKNNEPVWCPDEIRTPYAATSVKRAVSPIKQNTSNRESRIDIKYKKWNLHPKGAFPKNVISFPKDSGKNHPASFHLELPLHFIKAHSNPGDTVLDPFAGRGTTLKAAHQLGRIGMGFEIEPKYIELSKELYPEIWV